MSVYLVRGRGWRFDFTLKGIRQTGAWYKTKTEARKAETERRDELKRPKSVEKTPTDMGFLELVNRRLDHVKAYNSRQSLQGLCLYGQKMGSSDGVIWFVVILQMI